MCKKIITVISLMALFQISSFAAEEEDNYEMLTGDAKLACEAILCLSSPSRPSECDPALKRYYSIKAKKSSTQARKRQNFLNQCPKVDNSSSGSEGR